MNSKWIWYYGDFEMYHSKKLHLRRKERDVVFMAFWHLPEIYTDVRFRKTVKLEKEETLTVKANGVGFIQINNEKYGFEKPVILPAGEYDVLVMVSNLSGLPCIYAEGETVVSDESWEADCYNGRFRHVGTNPLYMDKESNPDIFKFEYIPLTPEVREVNGGMLYDFGREIFARVNVKRSSGKIGLYFGETDIEALDTDYSYLYEEFDGGFSGECGEAKGFRYIFVKGDAELEASYERLPGKAKGKFTCNDEKLNKIWEVAAHTFELNSREFYLDGIKRDRWVWSGDSYQSYFINRYLYFDENIAQRTIVALGGKGEVEQHINTIMDYTFYWLISIYDHYEMTGDKQFVKDIFPRMKAFIDFTVSRLDENGLADKADGDWIFIDWADMDKSGPLCAEQMLLLRGIEGFIACAKLLGEEYSGYEAVHKNLKTKINELYWNEEKGAFIDSFTSGKNNVTRHANIFALLFGYADEKRREQIIKNVLLNDEVAQIKTPYFKFYELEAMASVGEYEYVRERILDYWGAMIDIGSTSFWEEFDPSRAWQEQLDMYGIKYAKSLCHAWGSSPIYLIGRYLLGIRPTSPGYETFEVIPHLDGFEEVNAQIPVKGGIVTIEKKGADIKVSATKCGGTLITGKEKKEIECI